MREGHRSTAIIVASTIACFVSGFLYSSIIWAALGIWTALFLFKRKERYMTWRLMGAGSFAIVLSISLPIALIGLATIGGGRPFLLAEVGGALSTYVLSALTAVHVLYLAFPSPGKGVVAGIGFLFSNLFSLSVLLAGFWSDQLFNTSYISTNWQLMYYLSVQFLIALAMLPIAGRLGSVTADKLSAHEGAWA